MRRYLSIGWLAAWLATCRALDNGLGRTPAMGYNTWNDLRCGNVSDGAIRELADTMVALGLDELGYKYLNVNDCWIWDLGTDDEMMEDREAFPWGMDDLIDYVHSRGLLFGLYSGRGYRTCSLRPASAGHEELHALQLAAWGIDYLKYDSCWASQFRETALREYGVMRDALNATGRPILFSLVGWNPWYAPRGAGLGNSWRVAPDVDDWANVYVAVRTNEKLAEHAGPGGFNDPDMLIGSSPLAPVHLTPRQVQTQFSLWAVMAAPLLIGSPIRAMPKSDLETYTNKEVIAINQDPLGVQGAPIWSNCPDYVPWENFWNAPWTMTYTDAKKWSGLLFAFSLLVFPYTILAHQQVATDAFTRFCRRLVVAGTLGVYVVMGIIWMFQPGVDACQQVWARPLVGGEQAICLVNFARVEQEVVCDSACLRRAGLEGEVFVRDVVGHQDVGVLAEIRATLQGDGDSALFRVWRPASTSSSSLSEEAALSSSLPEESCAADGACPVPE